MIKTATKWIRPGTFFAPVQCIYRVKVIAPAQWSHRVKVITPAQWSHRVKIIAPAQWSHRVKVITPAQWSHRVKIIAPVQWSNRVKIIAPAQWSHSGTIFAVLLVFLMMSVMSTVLAGQPAVAAPGMTQMSAGTADEADRGENGDEVSAEVLLAGLDNIRDMRVSTHGNVFLVESGKNRLLKLTGDGERLDSLGRLGRGDYQFDMPVAIDPTNELKIYVADRNNRRIQVFDRRFQYLSTVRLPRRSGIASEYRPALLDVDAYGRLYFFDEDRHLMYRFDSHGQYELAFELFSEEERIRPGSMAILDDELWIADLRGQLLHRFSTRGSYLGFIYAPEPVRALGVFGDRIWGLGARRLMQLDSSGDIRFSISLPDLSVSGEAGDGPVMTDIPRWHRFDIHDNRIFLASESMLFRWQFPRPVRELLE